MSVAMAGIGVITNPRSRRNRKDPRLAQQLAYVMGEQGQLYAPGDLDALDQVAKHFLEREIDVLANKNRHWSLGDCGGGQRGSDLC